MDLFNTVILAIVETKIEMKALKNSILFSLLVIMMAGCVNLSSENNKKDSVEWKTQLQDGLSEFGHRNWILIVDKAFPLQNAEGVITIEAGENLLDVLSYTLQEIDISTHVKPVVYTDAELSFVTKEQVRDIETYRSSLNEVIGKYNPQVLLHDSVFVKIDHASKLFGVLVLKTDEVIPYSSVFIELDCKYWSAEEERDLREAMLE